MAEGNPGAYLSDKQHQQLLDAFNAGAVSLEELQLFRQQGLLKDDAWAGAFVPAIRNRPQEVQAALLGQQQAAPAAPAGPMMGPVDVDGPIPAGVLDTSGMTVPQKLPRRLDGRMMAKLLGGM